MFLLALSAFELVFSIARQRVDFRVAQRPEATSDDRLSDR